MRERILMSTAAIIRVHGIGAVTRRAVADRAQCSLALVSYHFGSMQGLIDAVVEQAVIREDLRVLAQGLSVKNPKALKASATLRNRAAKCLA